MNQYLSFYANRWLDVWYAGQLDSFFVIDYFFPGLPDTLAKFKWTSNDSDDLILMGGHPELSQKIHTMVKERYPTRTNFIDDKIKSFRNRNTCCCYKNGKLHNLSGPAIVWPDGTMEWWMNGFRHNKNGPAIIKSTGSVEYWINGREHDH